MKRLVTLLAVLALAVSAPVLACGAKAAGQMAGCPMMMKGVERTAQNLDNGVKITMTAKDAEQVKALQASISAEMKGESGCGDCPMHAKNVDKKVENTENGVVVMLTASDAAQVKSIQSFAAKSCGGGCPHGKGAEKSADRT